MGVETSPFSRVDNLLALPNGWACGLGVSDQRAASYIDDNFSPIYFTTGNVVTPTGWIALYLITAEELGYFTDGLNPHGKMPNAAALIGEATQANQISRLQSLKPRTRYCFGGFSVKAVIGSTPAITAPVIWNNLGGPLALWPCPYAIHTVIN